MDKLATSLLMIAEKIFITLPVLMFIIIVYCLTFAEVSLEDYRKLYTFKCPNNDKYIPVCMKDGIIRAYEYRCIRMNYSDYKLSETKGKILKVLSGTNND